MSEKISRIYDRLIVSFLCGLIFFLPISNALFEGFASLSIAFFILKRIHLYRITKQRAIAKSAVFAVTAKKFWEIFRPRPNPLNRAIAFLIVANILSVLFSQDPGLSLQSFFFKFLEGIMLFFIFLEVFRTPRRIGIWLLIFFFSGGLLGLDGIVQHFFGKDFIHGHLLGENIRATGPFKSANDFGTFLVFVLPVMIMSLFTREPISSFYGCSGKGPDSFSSKGFLSPMYFYRAILLCAVVFGFCSLIFSYSRGAWLAFTSSLVVLLFLTRRRGLLAVFLGVAALFIVFYPNLLMCRPWVHVTKTVQTASQPSDKGRVESAFLVLQEIFGSEMGRSGFWQQATTIIQAYPFFGSGINTYNYQIKEVYKYNGYYAHNCYLQMAAETGLVGLLAFLLVLISFFRVVTRSPVLKMQSIWTDFACGFLAGTAAVLIHGFFDTNFYSVRLAYLHWMGMGIVLAILEMNLANGNRSVYHRASN